MSRELETMIWLLVNPGGECSIVNWLMIMFCSPDCFAQTSTSMCIWCHCWDPEFTCHVWSWSMMYLWDLFSIKASDAEASWAEPCCTHASSLLLKKRACPRWPQRTSTQRMLNLSDSPEKTSFSCCSWFVYFALINLSHDYNLLLSLVSPFAKSVKLRGGWPSDLPDIKGLVQCLASSTHSVYASYGI